MEGPLDRERCQQSLLEETASVLRAGKVSRVGDQGREDSMYRRLLGHSTTALWWEIQRQQKGTNKNTKEH